MPKWNMGLYLVPELSNIKMLNYYYRSSISEFLSRNPNEIIGEITLSNQFDSVHSQNHSWERQIYILKKAVAGFKGEIFFEFSIPRMGKRVDVLLIINHIIFVIEFKVGESVYHGYNIDQVWDYALDLKNFHKPSHNAVIVPVLVATEAKESFLEISVTSHQDDLAGPVKCNAEGLRCALESALQFFETDNFINAKEYASGSYHPTPTIIEAAVSLYNDHSVDEITRSDAAAKNLTKTTECISAVIEQAKSNQKKIICFVTGVPGAGKTLVGLKVATTHLDKEKGDSCVYLSGNAPLVSILQEALTRDKVKREKLRGRKVTKSSVKEGVKSFIQIIHHYRDAYLADPKPPYDHVAIFDEAQRAWDYDQTVDFMKRKKNQPNFDFSEPEYLVSCLDRHEDWAVVVCLVGGGQEIHTGEAGISEWLRGVYNSFPHWEVYISPNLQDNEYEAIEEIERLRERTKVSFNKDLHLGVSMRSFRAENLSRFVKEVLDIQPQTAAKTLALFMDKYPIVLTRDLAVAKRWLKEKARGSERYGLVASSQAQRLKPLAIDVKSSMNPINWFLEGKDDVRSSFYLEDVATEFQVQGLELDWSCVIWDGDLRYSEDGWRTFSFRGKKWQHIRKEERKRYLINAYRVLLTRARQGMVIVVPSGSDEDPTRNPSFYGCTFEYLKGMGIPVI